MLISGMVLENEGIDDNNSDLKAMKYRSIRTYLIYGVHNRKIKIIEKKRKEYHSIFEKNEEEKLLLRWKNRRLDELKKKN